MASVAVLASIAATCYYYFGSPLDLIIFSVSIILRNPTPIQKFANIYLNGIIISLLGASTYFIGLQLSRYIITLSSKSSKSVDFPIKPMFFPCSTSHTRFFPKTHSFLYSYLLVGIPIGWKGSNGGMISADVESPSRSWFSLKPRGAWYTVHGDHYLGRGHVKGGLRHKLDDYLLSQGENPAEYPFAYLLTAARFLGYSSNPVSIWNLYSSSKDLTAVILEVNNTFDERHMYFLKSTPSTCSNSDEGKQELRFTQSWPKEFYVSPLNSRLGSYSVTARDPLAPGLTGDGMIDTTITLTSSEGHPKLVARVFSAALPIDPDSMSLFQKSVFLAKWWWVGLATMPRTVKEAFNLLVRRGLPWVPLPEPKASTISRHADPSEILAESLYRKYLRHMVESVETPLKLVYTPSGIPGGQEEIMVSPSTQLSSSDIEAETLEIKVTSPTFYSTLRRIQHPISALRISATPRNSHESPTIQMSNDALLSTLDFNLCPQPSPKTLASLSYSEKIQWAAVQMLRHHPMQLPPPPSATWSRENKFTSFEAYIFSHCSSSERQEYVRRNLKVMICERIAFGWSEVLDLEIFLVKGCCIWVLAGLLA